MDDALMQQSCRVALAAYLHDLGKFAERAGAFDRDPRLDAHLQMYCPWHRDGGWFSHRHAAHTALAFDLIEKHLPDLLGDFAGGNASPFAGRNRAHGEADVEPTDSLINAAAAHHKPETFLQWVIATADRVASGFEREEFDNYNKAKDESRDGLDHFTTRLLTLVEQIRPDGPPPCDEALNRRYGLKPLAPGTIFPAEASECEGRDRSRAKAEYRELWDSFVADFEQIPRSHRSNWPLWLDHFDSLWLTYTHAIPAATAFNVKPEVALYDHSRTTAAIAVALWRWHSATEQTGEAAARSLRDRGDYSENKFLLVQGDFFGIQNFVFATGGETRKQAAKLLRGRSFQVALFTELAAVRILDELSLPPTSQVRNAAGKFLIVAPNTEEVCRKLHALRDEFNTWFVGKTFGLAGMGLAWQTASCSDFLKSKEGETSRYGQLLKGLHESLNRAKHQRFDLCRNAAGILSHDFPYGVCEYNGWLPADIDKSGDKPASCALARDQIVIGECLLRFDRLIVVRRDAADHLHPSSQLKDLELDIFGYALAFTRDQGATGAFGELARGMVLRRCWDFSAADSSDSTGTKPIWAGYARRFISGYAPLVSDEDHTNRKRYPEVADDEFPEPRQLKTLDMIACEDRILDQERGWVGINALGILKGDVDNLGEMFRIGLGNQTFAKTAALSRQMNGFFAIYLPWLLAREFPGVYTVFAGGDDFFLIGPWRTAQKLLYRMQQEFARYAAGNADIHFSAGIATQKPGAPISVLAELAKTAIEAAKGRDGKNAVTCFNETVAWKDWPALEEAGNGLKSLKVGEALSSAYVYRLLQFVDMSEREKKARCPAASIWRARFKYHTRRYVDDKRKGLDERDKQRLFTRLAEEIDGAIIRLGSHYRIALFNQLYRTRTR